MSTQDTVKQILADVLQISVENFDESTSLIGSIPEFDSMAVVSVITALEENYGFYVDDDEIDADVFESIGTLIVFVESKL